MLLKSVVTVCSLARSNLLNLVLVLLKSTFSFNLIIFFATTSLCCIKNYQNRLDEKLKDLTTLEICILKYMNLILQNFFHFLD